MIENNPLIIELPENMKGKDYVIGDLHGCYDELLQLLKFVKFDIEKDRLFCVGDLKDRGPKQNECIALLDKKNKQGQQWFFSVLGNHDYVKNFLSKKLLKDYYKDLLAKLPYIYSVKHPFFKKFFIVHAEMRFFLQNMNNEEITNQLLNNNLSDEIFYSLDNNNIILSESQRKNIIWARDNFQYFVNKNQANITMGDFSFMFKEKNKQVVEKLKIFCGHNVVPFPIVIGHQIYCDTGACFGYNKPRLIEKFAKWGNRFFYLSMIDVNTGQVYGCVTSEKSEIYTEEDYKYNYKRGDVLTMNKTIY